MVDKNNKEIILEEVCSEIERKAIMRLKSRHGFNIEIPADLLNKECRIVTKMFCFTILQTLSGD